MVNAKSLCHLTILLLSLCFMVVKCSLEPTDQFIDNPTDTKQDALTLHKRPSFFVGSRYGRSGSSSSASGSSLFATSKTRRLNVVPRNDRFFLSSRYGKRAGMDFLQNNNNKYNNKKNNINDNSIPFVPLLSTPYEQALISEISTGTQLSNKPIPEQQQQHHQQLDDVLQQQSSSLPPYAYMSCVYTGLQNYYRCNSIDSTMFYFKNAAINDDDENENEVHSTGATGAGLLNDDNDDDDDSDDDNVANVNDIDDDDDEDDKK